MSSCAFPMLNTATRQSQDDARKALRLRRERAMKELEVVSRLEAELNGDDAKMPSGCSDDHNDGGKTYASPSSEAINNDEENNRSFMAAHDLAADEVTRYSRQMILPSFGVEAQRRLHHSSALIIGMGGLGSPAALYLAAAGVGRLGLVDRDEVDVSNLHRQIIHSACTVGQPKVKSAAAAIHNLNPHVSLDLFPDGFLPHSALSIAAKYDVIVDCTDNVSSRYLINDAAVLAGKPLVSGAAIGTDGQLSVYHAMTHHPAAAAMATTPSSKLLGPCYRCLFPQPPPAAACQRCNDSGVIGVVPGVIGCLQAMEAIKLLTGVGTTLAGRLLLYDSLAPTFTTVRLRARSPSCVVCGDSPSVTAASLPAFDYQAFTASPFNDQGPKPVTLLPPHLSVPPSHLARLRQPSSTLQPPSAPSSHILLDVRSKQQFAMAAIPGAISLPLSDLRQVLLQVKPVAATAAAGGTSAAIAAQAQTTASDADFSVAGMHGEQSGSTSSFNDGADAERQADEGSEGSGKEIRALLQQILRCMVDGQRVQEDSKKAAMHVGSVHGGGNTCAGSEDESEVLVICRRGNDSQRAVQLLLDAGARNVKNVEGGVQAWSKQVDERFPSY